MIPFELYKGKIVLDTKKAADIMDTFSSWITSLSEKESRSRILFVCLYASRSKDNPLRDLPERERYTTAITLAFGTKSSPSEEVRQDIQAAALRYYAETTDKLQKEIDLYDKKIYQFIELLDSTKPEISRNTHEMTDKISFTTNIDIINHVLENSLSILTDKAALLSLRNSGKYDRDLRPSLPFNKRSKLETINKKT